MIQDHFDLPDSLPDPLELAREKIEKEYLGKHGIHTVAIGLQKTNGIETGETAVIVYVADKAGLSDLRAQGVPIIPQCVEVIGGPDGGVPIDVQQMDPPTDLRLWMDDLHVMHGFYSASQSAQSCHNCPLPGGIQIAPRNANWVGTLGAALQYQDESGQWRYGALTNAHVTGLRTQGREMCQPHGRADWFAKVHRVVDMKFDGSANYIDAAILDASRTDGKFAPLTHTVRPVQLDLGPLAATIKNPTLGDNVIKSGRTTGITRGRCVAVEATSHVGYNEGTAVFRKQLVVEGPRLFSAGGDSGSCVLLESTKQPWGLLFAGGGNQTICNPIAFVLDWGKARFFTM